ncbi:MAG: hypothetical protein H6727_09520 [Myxococcales bacterium]|nr:hypothetical protein [Myxococcales bacterium]
MQYPQPRLYLLPSSLCLLFAALLLTLFVPSRPSHAFNLPVKKPRASIDINLSSVFEYHTYNPSTQRPSHAFQYFDLQNRLDIKATVDNVSFGGRVDTFNFLGDAAPCPAKFPNCAAAYIPEKLFFNIRLGQFDFTAGDYYLTIGRGLSLAIRKVDAFGLDTTLRGARATYQNGDFQATVAGGFTNANNFEPIQEIILDDPNDFIFAADVEQRFLKLFRLAGHYVFGRLDQRIVEADGTEKTLIRTTSHIAGGRITFPRVLEKMDFYFEGNVQFEDNNGLYRDPGYALYFNYNGYFFPFTVQFEAQWYSRYRFQTSFTQRYSTIATPPLLYLNQPSMERPDLDTQGDNANSKGLRLRVDYTFLNRTAILHLNYLFRYGFTDVAEAQQLLIHHAYAGFEYHGDIVHLNLSSGFRHISGFEYWRLIHADIDMSIRFLPKHAIDIVSRYWNNERGEVLLPNVPVEQQLRTYHIADAQIGYTFSGIGSIAFLFSYTNENSDPSIRQLYFAGELKILLSRFGYLKLFYGNVRGGLRCVSGVCRIFPPFEGFRTELLFRI